MISDRTRIFFFTGSSPGPGLTQGRILERVLRASTLGQTGQNVKLATLLHVVPRLEMRRHK